MKTAMKKAEKMYEFSSKKSVVLNFATSELLSRFSLIMTIFFEILRQETTKEDSINDPKGTKENQKNMFILRIQG